MKIKCNNCHVVIEVTKQQIVEDENCLNCDHRLHDMCRELNINLHKGIYISIYDFGCSRYK